MNCLNCGQLERLHGDPNLPAGDQSVCGDFEPDHEAVAERAEWYADMARDRDLDSRMEREVERRMEYPDPHVGEDRDLKRERVHDWERYPRED